MSEFIIYNVLFLCLLISTESARILAVFPFPSISHQVVFRPLTQELAKNGHEVVVITPNPAFPKGQTPDNLTEIDVHDVSYKIWQDQVTSLTTGNNDDMLTQMSRVLPLLPQIFDEQLKVEEVKNIIQDPNQHFDLLLLEACMKPTLALSHVFKVPVIQVSSLGSVSGNYEAIGAPIHPILYPSILRQRLNNLTIWEKMTELYTHYHMEYYFYKSEQLDTLYAKKQFGPNIPTMNELSNNINMLLLNVNPIWEGSRPVPPNVIYMGGLHQKEKKDLPKDLKLFLDSSKNGVIYLSFGTNVHPSFLPPEKIKMLVNVFSKLPYDILWKWDKDELPGRTKNIRISKWLPQSDLLRHPKLKLFITQGGLQSTDEAISAGVPLIGMPMLGDQWYNIEKYVQHKIGLRLDMETLTEEKLLNTINTIIEDESYRNNVVKLRSLMLDQPQQPLERAIWWIEHVLRHGGARHLRSPAANMSWSQYLELELVAIILVGLLSILAILYIAINKLFKLLKNSIINVKTKQH